MHQDHPNGALDLGKQSLTMFPLGCVHVFLPSFALLVEFKTAAIVFVEKGYKDIRHRHLISDALAADRELGDVDGGLW